METDKLAESAQFARKLYQAVLSLPTDIEPIRKIPSMAKALAVAQMLASRPQQISAR